MEMRAEAPAFVPTAPLVQPLPPQEAAAGSVEMVGDRLIRQLAAAIMPLPTPPTAATTRCFVITAAGLFCPYCAAGGPCSFHQPSSAGWEMLKLSVAGFASMQAGLRDRKIDDCEDPLGARRSLPPAPAGPPPSPPPPLGAADSGAISRDYFCTDCGSSTGTCLCNALSCIGGASGVSQLLGDGRRDGLVKNGMSEMEDFSKDVAWLEDVSTDAGGSEQACAESDVSDASLTGPGARRGPGGLQKMAAAQQHTALPYMSTVWMPNVRAAPAGAADVAGRSATVWYPARQGASWGTGAR